MKNESFVKFETAGIIINKFLLSEFSEKYYS